MRLSTEATADSLKGFDAVVIASGIQCGCVSLVSIPVLLDAISRRVAARNKYSGEVKCSEGAVWLPDVVCVAACIV